MIYLSLFFQFFKTGLFAVGGGLATLPFLYEISDNTGWFSTADIADMIAISESTPGAIGLNMSTYAGYQAAGVLGALCATAGLAAPSLIIIVVIAKFLQSFAENQYVKGAFYGLRPASIAMISAAGLNVVWMVLFGSNDIAISLGDLKWQAALLGIVLFIAMKKIKWHPVVFLAISAVVGMVLGF